RLVRLLCRERPALVHSFGLHGSLQLIARNSAFVDNCSFALLPALDQGELELVAVHRALLDVSRTAPATGRRFERSRQLATVAFEVEGILNCPFSKLHLAGPF